ncbi:unnamed protein product [Nezara viridula]|uniref:Uncharacterized protein n=1 Tax=Nezara viridula TaxID=85310 RepID=A0A9P0HKY0_NEZVI|nr:unnamed protein product [Nezara viridula]
MNHSRIPNTMPKISQRKKATYQRNAKKPVLFITLKKPKPTDPLDSREGFCYKDDMDEDDNKLSEKSESLEEIVHRRKKLPTKRDGDEVNKRKQGLVPKPLNTGGVKRKDIEEFLKEQMKKRCRKHNHSKTRALYANLL